MALNLPNLLRPITELRLGAVLLLLLITSWTPISRDIPIKASRMANGSAELLLEALTQIQIDGARVFAAQNPKLDALSILG